MKRLCANSKSAPKFNVLVRSHVRSADMGIGILKYCVRAPLVRYADVPAPNKGIYPYSDASCAFPRAPYDTRNFASLMYARADSKNGSSITRQPAENEGKNPYRWPVGNLDVPSYLPLTSNRYRPL